MTEGSIVKSVVMFSVPLMLSGILQLLYNAADIIVVGRFAGSESLAAVGSTGSLVNLIIGLFINLSVGTSVLVATAFGAKDYEKTQEALHTSVALSLVCGAVACVLGLIFSKTALILMDSPPEVIDLSDLYLKIFFLGAPANVFYNFGAMALRAVGDTRRPLEFLTISGIINVILNLFLVIVFKLDVAGVAIATVISQYISAILIFISLTKNTGYLHLDVKKIRFHKCSVIRILKIGIPAGIQGMIFSFSNVLIQSSVNSFGASAVAGNAAASNIEGFVYTTMNSIHHAAVTIVGQNVGAKRYDRIGKSVLCCSGLVTAIGLVMGISAVFFSKGLLSIYSTDPVVINYGVNRMKIIMLTHFTCGLMDVFVGAIRGLGSSFVPMMVSVIGVCGFRIAWIYTVFEVNRSLETLYISYPVSWICTALIQLACFFIIRHRVLKKEMQMIIFNMPIDK